MADDVDFYSDNPEDAELARKLRQGPHPPANPELLASLMRRRLGTDLDFKLVGTDRAVNDVRPILHKYLNELKNTAQLILDLPNADMDVDPWMLALDDLNFINGSKNNATSSSQELMRAINLFASLRVSVSRGRPPLDRRVQLVFEAVADYCERTGECRFTEPRSEKVSGQASPELMENAASRIARSALLAVRCNVTPSQLYTFMRSVREARAAG